MEMCRKKRLQKPKTDTKEGEDKTLGSTVNSVKEECMQLDKGGEKVETSDAYEVFQCINSCSFKIDGNRQRKGKASLMDSVDSIQPAARWLVPTRKNIERNPMIVTID